ncbi:hypothetical protein C8J56DRAFT_1169713 [Mycena floridula]|nr:hypothetical protein C8J56DRAFT_1169713 [Mycena floridula]
MSIAIFPFSNCAKCGQTMISAASNRKEQNSAYAARHRELLMSNHRTPALESIVLEEVSLLENQIDDLESRLEAAVLVVDQLRNELDQTQRATALRKAIIAPIRRLPSEVLEKIFMQARPSIWSPFEMDSIPWVTGQVCSRWRHISISSPRLWSSFQCIAGNDETNAEFCRKQLHIIQECLRRSGTFPLTFSLDISYHHWIYRPDTISVVEAIFSQSIRWKDVDFGRFSMEVPSNLISRLAGKLPRLKRLRVGNATALHKAFVVAPQLRELDNRSLDQSLFPYSQLHILRLTMYDWNQSLTILANCRNLVQCELFHSMPDTDVPPPNLTPVGPFNHLRSLHCRPPVLNVLGSMPVLEELHLKYIHHFQHFPHAQIHSLAAQLRFLSIELGASNLNHEQCQPLIHLFTTCTVLESLHFGYTGAWQDFYRCPIPLIEALCIDSTADSVMPSLKHLTLTVNEGDDVERWVQAVRPRCSPHGTLQSLHISSTSNRPWNPAAGILDTLRERLKDTQVHILALTQYQE